MANSLAAFGFRPLKSLSHGEIHMNYYKVASSAVRIGKGDLLQILNTGYVSRYTTASATGPFLGVAARDSGVPVAGGISKFPVYDDPNAIYEAQVGTTVAISVAYLNQNVGIKCSTVTSADTGQSQNSLLSTPLTNSTGVRLLRFVDRPDLTGTGIYAVMECHILNHVFGSDASGV